MKSGACYDAIVGRFLFWPLDGPVIPDKLTYGKLDNHLFATLNQFVIILSFIENVIFSFEDDAIMEIIEWGNKCKQRSYDERNHDECVSARLGKTVQHVYRIASFLQTIEIGFEICQEYIEHYQSYPPNGFINDDYVNNIADLYHLKYPDQFRLHESHSFRISKDVVVRAIDLVSCNMRQFTLLFDTTYAPKVSAIGRQVIVISPDQQQSLPDNQSSSQHKQFMNSKQRQRHISNFNNIAAAVILFPSVCFTLKQLHRSSVVHNHSGGGLLKEVIKKLLDTDILSVCIRGVKHTSRTTSVYIKRLPLIDNADAEEEFKNILSEYSYMGQPIAIDLYKKSCENVHLEAIGTVQEDVYQLLKRSEYGTRDFLNLLNLPKVTLYFGTSQYGDFDQNNPEENSLDNLSSYINQTGPYSSNPDLQIQDNMFEDVNFLHKEIHNSLNPLNTSNGQRDNNTNIVADHVQDNSSNNMDINGQLSDSNSNIVNVDNEQQDNNSSNTHLAKEKQVDSSNDIFYSPAACRTRSKLKIQDNMLHQKNLSSTHDFTSIVSCSKRKAKLPKRNAKHPKHTVKKS
ncbi:unnamed protein product [Adineta steineri]|uniref:Uncharacterized protein n=1 Tax=Adineta steineri TaxID=433720 RepID=A0A815D2Q3_9BILA|nr:unnamed protein product [Adineta steineri]CAF1476124.1 unnamed protein product [Adineta steineri]CAF3810666.1 unnamed protein product [Adineta steineri]CAF4021608.1 unnamed protein product [Adineta steineri]